MTVVNRILLTHTPIATNMRFPVTDGLVGSTGEQTQSFSPS